MKKITALLASLLCFVSAVGSVSADSETYTIRLRFDITESEGVRKIDDDIVLVDREYFEENTVYIPTQVYVEDPEAKVYAITAMWGSDLEFLYPERVNDPAVEGNPFTYGVMNADGTYTTNSKYRTVTANNERGLSCYYQTAYPEPLELLGEKSDSYPFAEFETNVVKDSRIPIYTLYFNTKENPDPETETYCTASYVNEDSIIPHTAQIEYSTLTFIIGEDTILGDMNLDGRVTPTDSAQVLSIYADKGSGADIEITQAQMLAGDINGDGALTATDAAEILAYYAYSSTTGSPLSFREYLDAKL